MIIIISGHGKGFNMNHDGLEIEFKWQASSNADFERFLAHARCLGAKIGPSKKIRIRDLYLDTESRYFARTGLKCRLRRAGKDWQLTLKSFSGLKKGLAQRQEKEISLPRFKSRTLALRHVNGLAASLLAGEPLRGLFEIRNCRTLRRLKLAYGAKAEASFDQVLISRHGQQVQMKEIEFEFLGGKLVCFKKFVHAITRSSGLQPQNKSKVATAISAFGLEMIRKGAAQRSKQNFFHLAKRLSALL